MQKQHHKRTCSPLPGILSCALWWWSLGVGSVLASGNPDDIDILALARNQPAEATAAVLAMRIPDRRAAMATLAAEPNPRCRAVFATVMGRTLDLELEPELARLAKEVRHPELRERMRKLRDNLEMDKLIHVELPDAAPGADGESAGAIAAAEGDSPFRPVSLTIEVPAADGPVRVQAFSEDFGIAVPFNQFAQAKAGRCRLDLFPGTWTLFAAGTTGEGQGFYICRPGLEIASDETLKLEPATTTKLRFRGLPEGRNLDEVLVLDSAYAGFLQPMNLGSSRGAEFALSVDSGERAVDIIGVTRPEKGEGFVLHGQGIEPDPGGAAAVGSDLPPATWQFAPAAGSDSPAIASATVEIWLRSLFSPEIKLDAKPPFNLHVTPGPLEMAFAVETAKGDQLAYHRRPYTLGTGQEQPIALGGPWECSIFHQFHPRFGGRRPDILTYCLFVRDPNGHYLSKYRAAGERGNPKPLPVAAHFDGKRIFHSIEAPAERTMQLVSEVEGLSREADLAEVEYRVRLPFEGDGSRERVLKGHGRDFEDRREHFHFEGPREVSDSAANWLDGAEKAYEAMQALLGHETMRREKGEAQGIRIQTMMPPGVGAFAGGGNTTFPVGSAFAMTRPDRILNVPFLHELLHTFAHGHKDYMAVTCRETAVRLYHGSPAARYVSKAGEQRDLLRCLRGEATPNPERVIASMLLRECGYDIFLKYFEQGRPVRERLWAADLTEPETDCAIFDWLSDSRARPLFGAAGAPLRPEEVDRGIALLEGEAAGGETAGTGGPNPKRLMGRAIGRLEQMLKANQQEAVPAQLDRIREHLEAVNDYRYRAEICCRTGEILFKSGLVEPAYAMLKECQRAAARVGPSFVPRARSMCMKVLKGEPTRTLM